MSLRILPTFVAILFIFSASASPAQETKEPGSSAVTQAQPAKVTEILPAVESPQFPIAQEKINGWKQWLDAGERTLRFRSISDSDLADLRSQASSRLADAQELIDAMAPRLDAANARAAELAPDPKSSAQQSDDVKLERARSLAEVSVRQSIIQQTKLISVRLQQLIETVSDRRRSRFTDSVLARSQGLISPSLWVSVASSAPDAATNSVSLAKMWWATIVSQPLAAIIMSMGLAAVLFIGYVSPFWRLIAVWTDRSATMEPVSDERRVRAATAIVLVGGLLPALLSFALYQLLFAVGLLPTDVASVARVLLAGVVLVAFLTKLSIALFAPGLPTWRLLGVNESVADELPKLTATIGFVISIGLVLRTILLSASAGDALSLVADGLTAIAVSLLFMRALRLVAGADKAEHDDPAASQAPRSAFRLLIPVGWVFATIGTVAPLAGFIALGRFVSHELVLVVAIGMTLTLLTMYSDVLVGSTFSFGGRMEHFLRRSAGLSQSAIRKLSVVARAFFRLALITCAIFLVLATWGMNKEDIASSFSSAFFGFSVGSITFSPSAIIVALAVLIVGVAATRIVQRWLERDFLPETSLDAGVQSSIGTGAGYVGVIAAAAVALSYIGLNLQNIAIVAGALSVGIGFGLQSIINNFVSGLILLVERPIKVGDRIEVGTRMGVVRRINVRATEIVTYDNLSVIVPNADLISGQVVNWMHGSFSARLSVVVGTSYNANPDRIISILLEIAQSHDRVLSSPAPFAILSDFAADALEFKVFFHVANIGVDAGVANEIRLEILKKFRAENIEIPYTQRDIHIRDLDRIEGIIRGLNERSTSSG